MKQKVFWVYAKDPGGWNGMEPVIRFLKKSGHTVHLFVSEGSKAEEFAYEVGLQCFSVENVDEMKTTFFSSFPDVFITSMCDRGLGPEIIKNLPKNVKTIALSDYWGGSLKVTWGDVRPDIMIVNDSVGADLVKKAWPDFSSEKIKITGYPALDRYHLNREKNASEAAKVVNQLGLDPSIPIIMFAGSLDHDCEILSDMLRILSTSNSVYFLPRMHPRMEREDPDGFKRWNEMLGEYANKEIIIQTSGIPIDILIYLADYIFSTYSMVLAEGAIYGKDGISVWYPEIEAGFKKATGDLMSEFPIVSLGCAHKVTNIFELEDAVLNCLSGSPDPFGLRIRQKEIFQLDGQNTQRAVDAILATVA